MRISPRGARRGLLSRSFKEANSNNLSYNGSQTGKSGKEKACPYNKLSSNLSVDKKGLSKPEKAWSELGEY